MNKKVIYYIIILIVIATASYYLGLSQNKPPLPVPISTGNINQNFIESIERIHKCDADFGLGCFGSGRVSSIETKYFYIYDLVSREGQRSYGLASKNSDDFYIVHVKD